MGACIGECAPEGMVVLWVPRAAGAHRLLFLANSLSSHHLRIGERDGLGHVQPGDSSIVLGMKPEVGGECGILFLASGARGSSCKMRWASNVTLRVRGGSTCRTSHRHSR